MEIPFQKLPDAWVIYKIYILKFIVEGYNFIQRTKSIYYFCVTWQPPFSIPTTVNKSKLTSLSTMSHFIITPTLNLV